MDEQILMRRFKEGDRDAFRHIYDLLQGRLVRYAQMKINHYRINNVFDAEDAVVEILYKLFIYREKLNSLDHISRWCFVSLHNYLIDTKRHNDRIVEAKDYEAWSCEESERFDNQVGGLGNIDMEVIRKCISILPHRQREVLQELLLNNLTSYEVGVKYGISTQTALNHKTKGLCNLRKALAKYGQ